MKLKEKLYNDKINECVEISWDVFKDHGRKKNKEQLKTIFLLPSLFIYLLFFGI